MILHIKWCKGKLEISASKLMQGQRVPYLKFLHMTGFSCKILDLHTIALARFPSPMCGPRDRADGSASEKPSGISRRVKVSLGGELCGTGMGTSAPVLE